MRLPKSFYERPLTPKEAQFATDNINIVWWYLDQQGLDRAEWFDVVILTSGNAKNMCFEYGTEKEAKTKLSTVSSHKRKWNEKNPKKYDAYRVGNCIYIVRLTGKKG